LKILVAEDDQNKRARLLEHVIPLVGEENVVAVGSIQGAVRALTTHPFSLIILDMSMPTFEVGPDDDGGRPQAYAGREVLRQIVRRKLHVMSVVVTQFDRFGQGKDALTLDQLRDALAVEHGPAYLGCIYYDPRSGEWKDALTKAIEMARAAGI